MFPDKKKLIFNNKRIPKLLLYPLKCGQVWLFKNVPSNAFDLSKTYKITHRKTFCKNLKLILKKLRTEQNKP